MTKEQIQASLLEKIEAARIDPDFPKGNILSMSFADTKTLAKAPVITPTVETITFNLPKTVRIIFTALTPVLIAFLLYNVPKYDTFGLIFVAAIALLIYLLLMGYFWLSDRYKDRLTINTSGIIFKNHLYLWDHILTTHIKRVVKSDEELQPQTFYYLVLGLDRGVLIDINFTQFSITGKFFPKTDEELTAFCWWIEHFKHLDMTGD